MLGIGQHPHSRQAVRHPQAAVQGLRGRHLDDAARRPRAQADRERLPVAARGHAGGAEGAGRSPGPLRQGARGAGGCPDARRGGGPRPGDETCPGPGGRSGTDGSALGGSARPGPADGASARGRAGGIARSAGGAPAQRRRAAAAADARPVTALFSPPEVALRVGQAGGLALVLVGAKDVQSIEVTLTWDPALAEVTDVAAGSLLTLDGSPVSAERALEVRPGPGPLLASGGRHRLGGGGVGDDEGPEGRVGLGRGGIAGGRPGRQHGAAGPARAEPAGGGAVTGARKA